VNRTGRRSFATSATKQTHEQKANKRAPAGALVAKEHERREI